MILRKLKVYKLTRSLCARINVDFSLLSVAFAISVGVAKGREVSARSRLISDSNSRK